MLKNTNIIPKFKLKFKLETGTDPFITYGNTLPTKCTDAFKSFTIYSISK